MPILPDPITETPKQPVIPQVEPSGLATLGRQQLSNVFSPIADGLDYYTTTQQVDLDFDTEGFISNNGFSAPVASYVRGQGINEQAAREAASFAEDMQLIDADIRAAGWAAQMVTDPALLLSIVVPTLPVIAGKALSLAGASPIPIVQSLLNATRVSGMSARKGAQLAVLDAMVMDTTVEGIRAANLLSEGQELKDVAVSAAATMAMTVSAAAVLGAGIGNFVGNRIEFSKTQAGREAAFIKMIRDVDDAVSGGTPREEALAAAMEGMPADFFREAQGKFNFTAEWFTNSIFYKAVPTPLKSVLQDAKLPDWAKLDMLKIINDSSMSLHLNKSGESVGPSIFQLSGVAQGRWATSVRGLNDIWGELNPRGGAEAMGLEVQNLFERVRKAVGRESFTQSDFYDHLVRQMITGADDLTDLETRGVAIIRKFFSDFLEDIEGANIRPSRDILSHRISTAAEGIQKEFGIVENAVRRNVTEVEHELSALDELIARKEARLASLDDNPRVLTESQIDLRRTIADEILEAEIRRDAFRELIIDLDQVVDVDDVFRLFRARGADLKGGKVMEIAEERIARLLATAEQVEARLSRYNAKSEEPYFSRFWDAAKIEANRDELRRIFMQHFRENPKTEVWDEVENAFVQKDMSTAPLDLYERADDAIESILNQNFNDTFNTAVNAGGGRHLLARQIDIPNSKVLDFIITDVREVMIAYSERMAPRIEWAKMFTKDVPIGGGQFRQVPLKFEEYLDNIRSRLADDGVPVKTINRYVKNMHVAYGRVIGTTMERPDAIDSKLAEVLKTATNWTFLGGAGVAAVADAAGILMDHELRTVTKGLIGIMDDMSLKMGLKEANLAGEAMEIIRGSTHLRYMESLNRDITSNNVTASINNAFFIGNGLGPITITIKSMEALLRGHTIIDTAIKMGKGTASAKDLETMLRYHITPELAQRIAAQPYEKSSGGLWVPNTDNWVDEDAITAFRVALKSGVMNRVIMGTPADKPILMDGVAYVPMSIARDLGMKEHHIVKGYARVESGLLSLPLTFYTFTMGALNKITANYAQGNVRNKALHFATAMFLGYNIVKFRTPNFAWDEMSAEDKMLRAFDFSGLAALHSDMGYRLLETVQGLGGAEDFPISPKFRSDPDTLGAAVSVLGAPADWAYGVAQGAGMLMRGEWQDSAKQMLRFTPLLSTLAFGGYAKDVTRGLANMLPEGNVE